MKFVVIASLMVLLFQIINTSVYINSIEMEQFHAIFLNW